MFLLNVIRATVDDGRVFKIAGKNKFPWTLLVLFSHQTGRTPNKAVVKNRIRTETDCIGPADFRSEGACVDQTQARTFNAVAGQQHQEN